MTNIMDLTVENLAKEQFEYLKEHSVNILNKVIECIKNEDFESVQKMLVYSPDGDDYGEENYYINFAYKKGMEMDINEIITTMQYLKEVLGNK